MYGRVRLFVCTSVDDVQTLVQTFIDMLCASLCVCVWMCVCIRTRYSKRAMPDDLAVWQYSLAGALTMKLRAQLQCDMTVTMSLVVAVSTSNLWSHLFDIP